MNGANAPSLRGLAQNHKFHAGAIDFTPVEDAFSAAGAHDPSNVAIDLSAHNGTNAWDRSCEFNVFFANDDAHTWREFGLHHFLKSLRQARATP